MGLEGYLVFGMYFLLCISEIQRGDLILYSTDDISKKKQVAYLTILLFLLGALRSYYTGTDTYYYAMRFQNQYSAMGLWEGLKFIKEAGIDGEKAFEALASLFKMYFPNAYLWHAFIWGIFVLECKKLIYRYSDNASFSFLYLVASLISTFMWQGLRQCIAATVCLAAFRHLVEKRYLRYSIFMLIAFLFHRSSLVFLLAVPASIMPVGIWSILLIIIVLVMSSFMPESIVNYLIGASDMLQMDGISQKMNLYISGIGTRTGTLSYFVVLLALYIVCYYVKDDLLSRDENSKLYLNLAMFGVCFQAMSVIIPEFFRVSYFFSIFNMILLPNACVAYSDRIQGGRMRLILIALLVLMFFGVGGFNYWFFWQQSAW